MRRVLLFSFLGALLTAVETGLLEAVELHDVALHASLGLIVYLAVEAGAVEGGLTAALVGYVWDLFAGTPPGMGMFLAVGVFVGARFLTQAVSVGPAVVFLVAGAAEAVWGLGALGLLALGGRLPTLALSPAVTHLLLQTLLAAVTALPIYRLARWLDARLGSGRDAGEVWLR